ncbi:hypothetical protein Tco_0323520 [Tanacetum coccineum]
MDVKTAFLNGDLEEEIYFKPTEGIHRLLDREGQGAQFLRALAEPWLVHMTKTGTTIRTLTRSGIDLVVSQHAKSKFQVEVESEHENNMKNMLMGSPSEGIEGDNGQTCELNMMKIYSICVFACKSENKDDKEIMEMGKHDNIKKRAAVGDVGDNIMDRHVKMMKIYSLCDFGCKSVGKDDMVIMV